MPIQSAASVISSIKWSIIPKIYDSNSPSGRIDEPNKLNFSNSDFDRCQLDLKDALTEPEMANIHRSLNSPSIYSDSIQNSEKDPFLVLKQLFRCSEDLVKLEEIADHDSIPQDSIRQSFLEKIGICREGVGKIFGKLIKDGFGSQLQQFAKSSSAPMLSDKTNTWIKQLFSKNSVSSQPEKSTVS